MPSFINRGARVANWFPLPGLLPWYVKHYVKDGGSWTSGLVTLMAEKERTAMGVSDFAEWEEWAKDIGGGGGGGKKKKVRGDAGSGDLKDCGSGIGKGACLEGDPLAAHMTPVPLM